MTASARNLSDREMSSATQLRGGEDKAVLPLSLLLIDDDRELSAMMRQFFQEYGWRIHAEHDGRRGLVAALSGTYDLIVLDVMMPGMDGFSVLEQIRRSSRTPVLMLTARSMHRDRIQGLNAGADDYLLKPFEPDELLARIHAILRRADVRRDDRMVWQKDDVRIDLRTREVTVSGETVGLTEMEFDLLEVLLRHAGRTVTRDELAMAVLKRAVGSQDRILDVHMSNLRKKIGPGRKLVQTVRGVGYVFAKTD